MSPRTRTYDDSRKRMTVLLCLGERPTHIGIHPEHTDRVRRTLDQYCALTANDAVLPERIVIVLSGGHTRKKQPSEATLASEYLTRLATERGITLPLVLLEDRSQTSVQNVVLTKQLLVEKKVLPTALYVIARESQVPKACLMCAASWPGLNTTMISGLDTKPWWHRTLNRVVATWLFKFDPNEKFRATFGQIRPS